MDTYDSENDLGYFKIYPAPMWEAMCKLNPAKSINSTTPHYGPLLYALGRVIGVHNVIEIGVAESYSSGFMAWAVKECNTRYAANGRFYGIDIGNKEFIQKQHDEAGLPSTFIQDVQGSVHWLENQKILGPETVDMVFIDGLHQTEYVQREVELLYPLVKGNGNGYICFHDVYSTVEEAFLPIARNPKYQWEMMRFLPNYGFGMLRKMENYDHKKVFWGPEGDQTELAVQAGICNLDGSLRPTEVQGLTQDGQPIVPWGVK